jgi:hypothetical protein
VAVLKEVALKQAQPEALFPGVKTTDIKTGNTSGRRAAI